MKLQSMVSFVFEQAQIEQSAQEFRGSVKNYARFLSQPLNLGMFIPCGENGLPMEPYIKTESEQISDNLNNCRIFSKEEVAYQQAVDRVLFEGVPLDAAKHHVCQGRTVEYLSYFGVSLIQTVIF